MILFKRRKQLTGGTNMALYESGEMYLETILVLYKRGLERVRAIDIVKEMNFSKPSVSRAMSILKKSGYIIMEPDGRIVLTENGLKKAASVLDRHKTLTVFLTDILNVPPDTAEKDACRIEHIISPVTFAGIKKMVKENRKK